MLCHLLGIHAPAQITRDPLVGAIFENLVVMECVKARYNAGLPADLYFFRDSNGNEVDLLIPGGDEIKALEIKSAATFRMDRLKGLRRFRNLAQSPTRNYLIYNGANRNLSEQTHALNFREIHSIFDPETGA